jgi:hypothetical protein
MMMMMAALGGLSSWSSPQIAPIKGNLLYTEHTNTLHMLLVCCLACPAGGLSSWSSSISVHNEILRTRPDLAEVLAGPHWFYDRKGEVRIHVFIVFVRY